MLAALANFSRNSIIIENIGKVALLSPIAYTKAVNTLWSQLLINDFQLVETLEEEFPTGLLLKPLSEWKEYTRYLTCLLPGESLCNFLQGISIANSPYEAYSEDLSLFYHNFPAGSSIQNLLYWRQLLTVGSQFQMYDYGEKLNDIKYGQKTPPLYKSENIREAVHFFVGLGDTFGDSYDATKWFAEMVNADKEITYYDLGTYSFLVSKRLVFFNDLIKFLKND